MANRTAKGNAAPGRKNKKRKAPKRNYRQLVISILIGLALVAFVLPDIMRFFNPVPDYAPTTSGNSNPASMPAEPAFTKEGELTFISGENGTAIHKIDIEKADNNMERSFGMMYRRSMEDSQGMLFLFDKSEQQAFWMKNTFIPLDIMFVDENNTITTIHKNAKPHDETSLPSNGNAKYVVEVKGGFADRYGIEIGDRIEW